MKCFGAFCAAKSNRYIEEITEEEYRETLKDIRKKAMLRGEETVAESLEEAYNAAENITIKNEALIHTLLDMGVNTLLDYIEKIPVDAFNNEVLALSGYCYEESEDTSAAFISKRYFRNFLYLVSNFLNM